MIFVLFCDTAILSTMPQRMEKNQVFNAYHDTHTHTHTHIYIYIYISVSVIACVTEVYYIQACKIHIIYDTRF